MVEVFKTNVTCKEQSRILVENIHNHFPGYKANFDLDDCDRILRIVAEDEQVVITRIINLLNNFGYWAAVLPG